MDLICIDLVGDRCTGCAGCVNACPNNALEIQLTAEGFYRPVLKVELCNHCGLCKKICPVLAMERDVLLKKPRSSPEVYAAWSTDTETHLASSSGGVFSEISKIVIENGGVVYGCSWNDRFEPQHVAVKTIDELAALRGSKYVQSYVGDTLSQAIKVADSGKQVLFSGTPCQIAALSQLLDLSVRSHMILVDIICHGVPSLRLFSAYKRWLFKGEPIASFTFRDKSLGLQTVCVRSISGRTYKRRASDDPFFRLGYGNHLSMMKSCFKCKFSGESRVSDITLGDFWGAPKELDNPRGVSAVLVNSPIGKKICNKANGTGSLHMVPIDLGMVTKMNPRVTGGEWRLPLKRHAFLQDVASGRSFKWIYWRWYVPNRIVKKTKSGFRSVAVWLIRTLKVKGILLFIKKSIFLSDSR